MEVYVKETLHVLDYDNNIKDTIFISDDHRTAGYAYNINITEANTGYSDLTFDMPNTIIDENGNQLKNPKLALLTPLVKLRYNRTVYYMGEKEITVREPIGYGDKVEYQDVTYSNTYPNNIIEDYVMDYIVQPIDKKRNSLTITTSFTAIDYPRFTLSKKKVGLNIGNETITKPEWSLFQNKPMDQAGLIKYVQWTSDLSTTAHAGNDEASPIPLVWDPVNAKEYPLKKENIEKLLLAADEWPYGQLATAFYWPIVSTGRFDGVMYKEHGFLVLQLYDFYDLNVNNADPDTYIKPELGAERYAWEWTQIYEVDNLLAPNNALNYLRYVLDGTSWTIGEVDIEKIQVSKPDGYTGEPYEEVDKQCSISVSGSNCYNAITAICQGMQLYPVFDCINQTVSLKLFAGKNYGLTYYLGSNIKDDNVKHNGEKVITKLYCSGGVDNVGSAKINIGPAERSHIQTFAGFYQKVEDLPTKDVKGYWAIVDDSLSDDAFNVIKYKIDENEASETYGKLIQYTEVVHDFLVQNYWVPGDNRKVYYYIKNQGWELGELQSNGLWSVMVGDTYKLVEPDTGIEADWDPNNESYIISRSPYGTNYIINLKWHYQNKWITKEKILELYQYNLQINDLNKAFIDKYKLDLSITQENYYKAVNNYEIAQQSYQATLAAMMNKYYINDENYSEGTRSCFHVAPGGTYTKLEDGKEKSYIKLHHCYTCGYTEPIPLTETGEPGENPTVCLRDGCGSTDITNDEIYIPVYDDYKWNRIPSMYEYGEDDGTTPNYDPHLKGYFQRLVTSLDRANANDEQWPITKYEELVSMIEPIPYQSSDSSIDGFEYQIKDVYVRSTSGQIEVWNDAIAQYIKNYGLMLDYLRDVNTCLEKIERLQQLYEDWDSVIDNINLIIQEKFGDFLIEGNYNNDEQPYVSLLFAEGQEASDKYSVPEVTYNLNVVDSSGLIEYREPQLTKYRCHFCGYTSFNGYSLCPQCNGSLISHEHDIYNDLVHMLHSVGQIIPKAGDYITIYDEPMGMYGVPGLITQITRILDNPVQNGIQIDTAYTDDEELVGNIITATNTVLSNQDIYARTAVLKRDGSIDSSSIKTSLDDPNANISIVGTNGNILLTGAGLRATDPTDDSKAMKYTGTGIYKTSNLNDGAGAIWEKMVTPDGIMATYLNAGTIDTNKITITSGLNGTVMIDQYGLGVKNSPAQSLHLSSFDTDRAKQEANYTKEWGDKANIASFIGVDRKNTPLIYTKGYLVAESGSNIAGWITSNEKDNAGFFHLVDDTTTGQKDLWLSPDGIKANSIVNVVDSNGNKVTESTYSIYSNGNFGVTKDGKLHAQGAIISGNLHASTLTLDSSVQIHKDNLTSTYLYIDGENTKIKSNIVDIEGDIVSIKGDTTKISSRLTTVESDIITLEGTTTDLNSKYINLNGSVATINTNITNIKSSMVTIGNLTDGVTKISGNNIKSGTISGITLEGVVLNIKDGANWKFRIGANGGLYCNGYDTTSNTTTFAISQNGNMHIGRNDGNSTFKLYTKGYDVDGATVRSDNGKTGTIAANAVLRFINGIFVGTGTSW